MTAWRILSKHGYMTSYNFNATYYTLADIPQFDKDGLWSYRNILFSKYGSLTDTVTALVCSSRSGLDANELQGLLAVNVTPTLTNLYQKGKLKRQKVGGVFVYLHAEQKERQTQLTMRQAKREKALEPMALPEPERIIAVLVELIKRVELQPQQIARRLSTKGSKITLAEIQAIFAHYQLPQKKPLELLRLRAQLIGQVHGSLPAHCLLPKHYVLDVVNDRTFCDHCHCGLRIQRTLIRYPLGILLGEPILRHHIKKCPVCGREYPYEQLNDLVPPHGNYAYDIIIEVGCKRFQHHRQNQEIQKDVQNRYGLALPETSINNLANRFLDYLAAVHYANAPAMRQMINDNGGYVGHFDGTCEAGTDILFTAIDEISGIVLLTCRMPTENVNDIKEFLEKCRKLFGVPLATMRDLSQNIALARDQVFDAVTDLICQYHFLENVGKALFKKTHQELTTLLRKLKIRPGLKSLRNGLVRWSKNIPPIPEKEFNEFLKSPDKQLQFDHGMLRKYLTHFIFRRTQEYLTVQQTGWQTNTSPTPSTFDH